MTIINQEANHLIILVFKSDFPKQYTSIYCRSFHAIYNSLKEKNKPEAHECLRQSYNKTKKQHYLMVISLRYRELSETSNNNNII